AGRRHPGGLLPLLRGRRLVAAVPARRLVDPGGSASEGGAQRVELDRAAFTPEGLLLREEQSHLPGAARPRGACRPDTLAFAGEVRQDARAGGARWPAQRSARDGPWLPRSSRRNSRNLSSSAAMSAKVSVPRVVAVVLNWCGEAL